VAAFDVGVEHRSCPLTIALDGDVLADTDHAAVLGDHPRGEADELTEADGIGKRLARRDHDRRGPLP